MGEESNALRDLADLLREFEIKQPPVPDLKQDRMGTTATAGKQALFYERVVPVSRNRHSSYSVQTSRGYGFAANTGCVPIVVAEFASVAREYPIIFVEHADGATPVALFGVRQDKNPLVTEDGGWRGTYVPAFVRRYPFILASGEKPGESIVCIDEEFAGFNELGQGEKLFEQDGKQTSFLSNVSRFLRTLKRYSESTKDFAKTLSSYGLLASAKVQSEGRDGRKVAISGAMIVDRSKLKALPADKLAELAQRDHLEPIFQHLASLANGGRFGKAQSAGEPFADRAGKLLS